MAAQFNADVLRDALAALIPSLADAQLCVALSGGLDSVALLHATHELARREPGLALRAVHVDHGLQPASGDWARRCAASCAALSVPLAIIRLQLEAGRGASVEAVARAARYAALAETLGNGEWLLTAQHADDQLETVLLQLFRGAGVAGLAAMPAAAPLGRGVHLRPLLKVTRAAIEAYARESGLDWVEDPMNTAQRFDRAFLRRHVTPMLRSRWPAVAQTVLRAAGHLAGAQDLLRTLAANDGEPLLDAGRLRIAGLMSLPRVRQANVLRWWIRRQRLGMPSTARLDAIIDDVLPAREDAQPVVTWQTGEVRRYRGRLFAMWPLERVPGGPWPLRPGRPVVIKGVGTLALVEATGRGLRVARCQQPLQVRLPRGGERLRPAGQTIEKSVRRLLQEAGVEPWLRSRVPLIYAGDQLLAAGDSWIAAEFAAGAAEQGFAIEWTRSSASP